MADHFPNVTKKVDFIRREAAEQFICEVCELPCPRPWGNDCEIIRRLNKIPPADLAEVVRCKDCINWNGNDCITMFGLNAPRPDDYCSRGEKNIG